MRLKLWLIGIMALLLLSAGAVFGKDKEKPDPFAKVDKQQVETAIKKGIGFLLECIKRNRPLQPSLSPPNQEKITAEELVLYTLIKGGAKTDDEEFKALLEKCLAKKLERTYPVSVLAMALEELDSKKYQAQIAECGQFLIDNQCKNGQWDYGQPVEPLNVKITPSDSPKEGTQATKQIPLRRRKEGPATGDNSNMQYACLGLRACMQAGVIIPPEVFQKTIQWLEKKQQGDGGWGYDSPHGNQISPAYGSMTVGALGSLIICKYYLTKQVPARDAKVIKGLDWVIKNFTVKENPKFGQPGAPLGSPSPQMWYYYYLYAMERLGAFLETELFGKYEWYPTGAEVLLAAQEANGGWREGRIDDTCFAILFLRRGTKPLRPKVSK